MTRHFIYPFAAATQRTGLGLFLALALVITPATAQSPELDPTLIKVAETTLAGIQHNSFAANREYCGMIGRNSAGQIVITRPRKGRRDSCVPRNFWRRSIEVLASYHTHGRHHPDIDAEVPSLDDLRADTDEGVIGFVSTPGGRFWVTEPSKARVRLICDAGCLPEDPRYDAASTGQIRAIYTAQQLSDREEGVDD